MSNYIYKRVLRLPITSQMLEQVQAVDVNEFEKILQLDKDLNSDFAVVNAYNRMSSTYTSYLDYILEKTYDNITGDFGHYELLLTSTSTKAKKLFDNLLTPLNINYNFLDIRLVEFCYYNVCEMPDYYNLNIYKDDF